MQKFKALAVAAGVFVTSASVNAASMLPTGVYTGATGDALDTIKDIMTYLIPLAIGVTIAKAPLGWSKSGTSRAIK